MKLTGKAWVFGDNIDTDVIIPARRLNISTAEELAKYVMEDLDPSLAGKIQPGDIFVAGKNFGCGSSREHAPLALKGAGVACVIAESFARIFYRNAINIGLPILESPEAARHIRQGDQVTVDLSTGVIIDETTGEQFQSEPYPEFILQIIRAGGLITKTRQDLLGGAA
ncbi:MAG: 3-isopropylmalate dehydratase small subunit [Anaerolineae bacterium]